MGKDFNMKKLKEMFTLAIEVENSDYKKSEIIINPRENFEDKFEYYLQAYDENLVLKNCSKIRIVNVIFSNSLEDTFSKIG